ncbi:MAG: hypothetical protein HKN18_04680 [Silicimonas sp.]|nr:hypothetical protein [Silicimonas sp.]
MTHSDLLGDLLDRIYQTRAQTRGGSDSDERRSQLISGTAHLIMALTYLEVGPVIC